MCKKEASIQENNSISPATEPCLCPRALGPTAPEPSVQAVGVVPEHKGR